MEFILEVWDNPNSDGGPKWLQVNIDSKRLKKLKEYAEIVKSTGVYAVVDWDNSTKWFNDDDLQNEVRMDAKTVHVYLHGFQYEAYVKNMDVVCTTVEILFQDVEGKDLDEEETDQPNTQTSTETDSNS